MAHKLRVRASNPLGKRSVVAVTAGRRAPPFCQGGGGGGRRDAHVTAALAVRHRQVGGPGCPLPAVLCRSRLVVVACSETGNLGLAERAAARETASPWQGGRGRWLP